jgi:tetratricopeptide (TPR) repeat protein
MMALPNDTFKDFEYGGAFLEIHLDERFYVGEYSQLCYTSRDKNGHICVDASKRLYYDPDQCIDFISSYTWQDIFLTLTDKFSFMLPIIHDLPQIVNIYIYSETPDKIDFKISNYPKLRAIVHKDSPNADQQLLEDIEIFKRDLLKVNVNNPIIRQAVLFTKDTSNHGDLSVIQEQNNGEYDLPVIWIQDDDKNMINLSTVKNRIKSIKMYVNIDECIHDIQSFDDDDVQVFLISSKSDNDIFLRQIVHLTKIRFIYILHTKENLNSSLKALSNKIRGIYFNTNDLCDHLLRDYICTLKMSVSIFNKDKKNRTVRNLHEDNARFLWLQLLIDILIQIPHNCQTLDEILEECKNYENKNESTKKAIEELRQNYKSNEALRYYTGASFLFRLFNEALRTENIDFLFVFRFFLADVYNQLRQLYTEQFLNDNIDINQRLQLFRGQSMTIVEFDMIKENVGRLISINSFFSTSTNYDVATTFAGFGDQDKPSGTISVVFQIEIDDIGHSLKRPFASLQEFSKIKDENEILFSVGTIFRIEEVLDVPGTTKDWFVTLKLVNDDDDNEITELRKELEKEFCKDCDLCSLGSVLIKMGDYDKAERYFQIILEHVSTNQATIPLVYTHLGIIYHNKGDYQKAVKYHQQALEYYTKRNQFYHHDNDIGATYTHIGSNYHQFGNNQLALEYMTKATQIQNTPRKHAFTLNQIAVIHRDNGDYKQALEYFQKVLDIDENILKLNKYNPSLATTYNNIGEIYIHLKDYENALKTLEYALDIRLKGTVSTHTDLAAIYNNLGVAYRGRQCSEKALEMYNKALEIDMKALPENHPSLGVTHNNIALIHSDKGDLIKALYHQEIAVRILLKSDAKNNTALLAGYQYNLGCIQLKLGNNRKALNILEKSLKNHSECLSKDHENFSNVYALLSSAYETEGNIPKAFEYIEKAVENARISLLPHDAAKFNILQAKLDMLKAQYYSEEQEKPPSDDFIQRIILLNTVGTVYSKDINYQMARKCFQTAISLYNQRHSLTLVEEQQLEDMMTIIYFNFARLYYRQQNREMAFEILEKSLNLASKQDQSNVMLAEVYNFAGIMFGFKRDLAKAEHYFTLAVDIARKFLPNNHPNLQRYHLQLKQLKDFKQHI